MILNHSKVLCFISLFPLETLKKVFSDEVGRRCLVIVKKLYEKLNFRRANSWVKFFNNLWICQVCDASKGGTKCPPYIARQACRDIKLGRKCQKAANNLSLPKIVSSLISPPHWGDQQCSARLCRSGWTDLILFLIGMLCQQATKIRLSWFVTIDAHHALDVFQF